MGRFAVEKPWFCSESSLMWEKTWKNKNNKQPIFLGMVTIPPIKMVMTGGWSMTLFYPY